MKKGQIVTIKRTPSNLTKWHNFVKGDKVKIIDYAGMG